MHAYIGIHNQCNLSHNTSTIVAFRVKDHNIQIINMTLWKTVTKVSITSSHLGTRRITEAAY